MKHGQDAFYFWLLRWVMIFDTLLDEFEPGKFRKDYNFPSYPSLILDREELLKDYWDDAIESGFFRGVIEQLSVEAELIKSPRVKGEKMP